jgi:hypothetical protein
MSYRVTTASRPQRPTEYERYRPDTTTRPSSSVSSTVRPEQTLDVAPDPATMSSRTGGNVQTVAPSRRVVPPATQTSLGETLFERKKGLGNQSHNT